MSYIPWLKNLGLNDVYMAALGGYYKLDDLQAISASMRYFSLGTIQFTDNLGNDYGTFRPSEGEVVRFEKNGKKYDILVKINQIKKGWFKDEVKEFAGF